MDPSLKCTIPEEGEFLRPLRQTSSQRAPDSLPTTIILWKIAFNSPLGLHFDGAVLQRYCTCADAAASEHAAVAPYAALGMGHLEPAARYRLCSRTVIFFFCSLSVW